MSESVEAIRPELSEQDGNKVYHLGDVDAVVPRRNLSDGTYMEMLELASLAQKGDLSTLETAGGSRAGEGRFHYLPSSGAGGERLFIKQKKNTDIKTDATKENHYNLRRAPKENLNEHDLDELHGLNAMHSMLNELNISSDIEKILQGSKIREAVTGLGFSALELVSPKFAVLNRNNQRQYMAYPDVSGAVSTFELRGKIRSEDPNVTENEKDRCRQQVERLKELTRSLHDILIEAGIVPYDIHDTQLLYDDLTGKVHIIDIEGWHKDSTIGEKANVDAEK